MIVVDNRKRIIIERAFIEKVDEIIRTIDYIAKTDYYSDEEQFLSTIKRYNNMNKLLTLKDINYLLRVYLNYKQSYDICMAYFLNK